MLNYKVGIQFVNRAVLYINAYLERFAPDFYNCMARGAFDSVPRSIRPTNHYRSIVQKGIS